MDRKKSAMSIYRAGSLRWGMGFLAALSMMVGAEVVGAQEHTISISPAVINPDPDGVIEFSVNANEIPVPGLQLYGVALNFSGADIELLDSVKTGVFNAGSPPLPDPSKISCSAKLNDGLKIKQVIAGLGENLVSGYGAFFFDGKGVEDITVINNGSVGAGGDLERNYAFTFKGEGVSPPVGSGSLIDMVCLVGANVPAGARITVTPTLLPNESGVVVLSDSQLLEASGDQFIPGVIEIPVVVDAVDLTNPGDQADDEGDNVSLALQAVAPPGVTLEYSVQNQPPGLNIDTGTGIISGVVSFSAASASPYSVSVTATDQDGNFPPDTETFLWTVNDVNQPPIVTNPGPQSSDEGDSVSLPIGANDPDGDSFTFSAVGLPANLGINPTTGVISGVLSADSSGNYSVTVTVTDGKTNGTTPIVFAWDVGNVNRAPQVTNPGNQNDAENDLVSLQIAATDADGDTLTYSETGLPTGLTINSTTGLISGTLGFDSAGNHSVTVTVDDGRVNGSVSVPFTWTVSDTNRAPQLTNPGTQSGSEGDSPSLQIQSSEPDSDPLTWSATGLPDGLSINSSSGSIGGTLSFTSAGSHTVVVTANDGKPNGSVDVSFVWDVADVNQSPDLTNPGDMSNDEGDSPRLFIESNEPDNDPLTWSETGLPDGLSINSSSGFIGGTLSFTSAGSYNVVVTADDGKPNGSVEVAFVWTVNDVNRSPEVTNPGPQSDPEGEDISLAIVATDLDEDALDYSATGLPSGLSIDSTSGEIAGTIDFAAAGSHNVVVTVNDGKTNGSVDVPFIWTVADTNRHPVIDELPNCNFDEGVAVSTALGASDPDDDVLTYSASGLPPEVSINPTTGVLSGTPTFESEGEYSVVFMVTDDGTPSLTSPESEVTCVVQHGNSPPQVENPGDQVSRVGADVDVTVVASDVIDSDTLSFSVDVLPTGLTIDEDSGAITGTVAEGAKSETVTVTVTDNGAPAPEAASVSFLFTINVAPILNEVADLVGTPGELLKVTVTATDPDGDALSLTAVNLPEGASFVDNGDGSGDFEWTPQIRQISEMLADVEFTVEDDSPAAASDTVAVPVSIQGCPFAGGSQLPRSGQDMDCDGTDEVMVRNGDLLSYYKSDGSSHFTGGLPLDWKVVAGGDLNGDGYAEAVVRNGEFLSFMFADGPAQSISAGLTSLWEVKGIGDFDDNKSADVMVRGGVDISYLGQDGVAHAIVALPEEWTIHGVGDVDNVGGVDILIRNKDILSFFTQGVGPSYLTHLGEDWKVVGVGDFRADAVDQAQVLVRNGMFLSMVEKNGDAAVVTFIGDLSPAWSIKATGDYDGDGADDVLVQNGDQLGYYDIASGGVSVIDNVAPGWAVVPAGPESSLVTALAPVSAQLGNLTYYSQVSAGLNHSCAVVEGEVSCWGDNSEGQTTVPELVSPIQVSAGGQHSCALDQVGVVCWGSNLYGQSNVPELVAPTAISAGGQHSCALDEGTVVCWGDNSEGQTTVPELVNPTQISAGGQHSCALDQVGVVCWGANLYGQSDVPELVNPTEVSAGTLHSCAVDDTGVVCWGNGASGQIDAPPLTNPSQVSAGQFHSCAVVDKAVVCWGGDAMGQSTVPELGYVASVSAGGEHSCAVTDVGVVCWGSDVSGQSNLPAAEAEEPAEEVDETEVEAEAPAEAEDPAL